MTTSVDTTSPVVGIEPDAVALGKQLLSDAKAAIEAVLTKFDADVANAVPVLTPDIENIVLEFVPSAYRSLITPFFKSAEAALNPNLDASIAALLKAVLGIALTRIDALL